MVKKPVAEKATLEKYGPLFPATSSAEIKKQRELTLHKYAVIIEITWLQEGKLQRKTLTFRVRHGEC